MLLLVNVQNFPMMRLSKLNPNRIVASKVSLEQSKRFLNFRRVRAEAREFVDVQKQMLTGLAHVVVSTTVLLGTASGGMVIYDKVATKYKDKKWPSQKSM